jgi:SAM-dependent methyltransferase
MTYNGNKFEGAIPEVYEHYLVPLIFEAYAEDLAGRVDVSPDARILETAAGTGVLTRQLQDILPTTAQIVATDFHPAMLAVAEERSEWVGNVDYQVANGMDLPFDDGSFDALLCQFGMMFYPDKELGYREAARVLKPGGQFIFNLWDTLETNPIAKLVHEIVAELDPDNPPDFLTVPFAHWDLPAIRTELRSAGFEDVGTVVLPRECRGRSARDVAIAFTAGSPLATQLAERGIAEEALQAVEAALLREFGHGEVAAPMQAIAVTARAR